MQSKHKSIFLALIILLSYLNKGTYVKKDLDSEIDGSTESREYKLDTEEGESENAIEDSFTESRRYGVGTASQGAIIGQQQGSKDSLILKEEISNLKKEIQEQKDLMRTQGDTVTRLLDRSTDIINYESNIITDLREATAAIQGFSNYTMSFINLQKKYLNAFLFNKEGKPAAYIDFPELKLYEYNTGNLLGWIDPEKNEVIRNYDGSTVATIENDFLIDAQGSPIASIERSENLKWEREKLMIQKNPVSHFFVMASAPQQFIQTKFRTSDWSAQRLEDVLFFSEKNIQKLK